MGYCYHESHVGSKRGGIGTNTSRNLGYERTVLVDSTKDLKDTIQRSSACRSAIKVLSGMKSNLPNHY